MTMRKWMLIIIPTVLLLLFTAVFAGGGILKKPFGKDDQILYSMQQLEKTVKQKNWKQAKNRTKYIDKAWDKVSDRIQYSVERDYMYDISSVIARIKGGVEARDDKAILEEIYFFYDLWDSLGE